jgi:predicted Zn-dependent protease
MRLGILLLVLVATIFGSGYWYGELTATCKAPIHYRIGAVDPRFDTDTKELVRIAQNAEAIWETPLGKDLFIYDEKASLPINLVFDNRQADAEKAQELKDDLKTKEGMSESVSKQYETLISQFRTLKKTYENRVIAYETKLSQYNNTVNEWNKKGGAPQSVVDDLRTTQVSLTSEQKELSVQAKKLNNLASQLNAIGAKGNSLITDYNTVVKEYNSKFGEAKEFTQGDYTGTNIDIYQFNTETELTIVLAHEFGHALSLAHVENEKSIMYPVMGAQSIATGISAEDKAEFTKECGQTSFMAHMLHFVHSVV